MKKSILLFLYYSVAFFIPMQPIPGYSVGYFFRRVLGQRLFAFCGEDVVIKNRCYFGDGTRLSVGDRTQLGQNSRLNGMISFGADVLMGPDVVMMATSHAFADLKTPINQQGELPESPIKVGDNVWIGTRSVILPGVSIGSGTIVAAGSIVTKSFPENSIVGGNPARLIRVRS